MPPFRESPSQTAGPYVHIGLLPGAQGTLGDGPIDFGWGPVPAGNGPRIQLIGRIFDGSGAPVVDALVELWQCDGDGVFRNGFGRAPCDADGTFRFETVKPGRPRDADGTLHAPHLTLWIVARGINMGLHTRVYFDDEVEANAEDPVLGAVPPARRATLVARRASAADGVAHYAHEICLQGDGETVFFDI